MKALPTALLAIGGVIFALGMVARRVLTAEQLEPYGGRGVILVAYLIGGLLLGGGFLLRHRSEKRANEVGARNDEER